MINNKHECPSDQYLPNQRTGYKPDQKSLESCSEEGLNSMLPSTVTDEIVVNNIASSEFDYTEEPYVNSELDTNA